MSRDKEERRSPRIVTENLAGSMTLALEADILNVSRGGLAIRTRHQLRIGKQYHIQIGRDERRPATSNRSTRPESNSSRP
jgi:hypothetical protein